MKIKALVLAGAAILVSASAASAQTVAYTNGPINGTYGGNTINYGWQVTDSFTLAAQTTLNGFSFGGWTSPGDPITSVAYGFSTLPDFAVTGTTSLTNSGSIAGAGAGSYDVRNYSASIAPVTLGAGTYYFALQNAVANNGAFWDINQGSSTAYQQNVAAGYPVFSESSHAFNLFEAAAPTGAVPEPATWAMMIAGFGMVGFAMRRRQSVKTTVRFA